MFGFMKKKEKEVVYGLEGAIIAMTNTFHPKTAKKADAEAKTTQNADGSTTVDTGGK